MDLLDRELTWVQDGYKSDYNRRDHHRARSFNHSGGL